MLAQITLTGTVGKDPVQHQFENSKKATFSVAINEKRNDEQVTTWYECEVWNDNTDIIMERIRKGKQVIIKGQLSLRPYYSNKHKKEMTQALVKLTSFQLLETQSNQVLEVKGE